MEKCCETCLYHIPKRITTTEVGHLAKKKSYWKCAINGRGRFNEEGIKCENYEARTEDLLKQWVYLCHCPDKERKAFIEKRKGLS